MRKWAFILFGLISLLAISYIRFNSHFFSRMVKSKKCEHELEAKDIAISGRVTSKYTDDRTFRWIEFLKNGETEKIGIFVSEVNDAFGRVAVGDSIIKEQGSLRLVVIRNNETFNIMLDYGCAN